MPDKHETAVMGIAWRGARSNADGHHPGGTAALVAMAIEKRAAAPP